MAKNTARGAVVITGASTGIGRATALRLDRHGHHVFAGVRKESDGDALKQEASGSLTPLLIDVTDEKSIAAAVDTVGDAVGEKGLAGLVNNAGITVSSPVEFVPLDEVRRQFEINFFGHIAVTQSFIPLLRKAHGRIVNMSSIGGKNALPLMAPYCASKFAMEGFSDSLRMELQPWGIHVSVIEPGSIKTPLWDKGVNQADELLERLPAAANELYGEAVIKAKVAADREAKRGSPPEKVAIAVEHALTATRPKTRYLVGLDARAVSLVKKLPDRAVDKLIRQQIGL